MTASSDRWDQHWGRAPDRFPVSDRMLSRRQARRMSRQFADVGVGIPAARLREIAAGAPYASEEMMNVNFALTASEMKRQERRAKFRRNQRRLVYWLIVAGMVLAALNLLLCMTFGFIALALHESPW